LKKRSGTLAAIAKGAPLVTANKRQTHLGIDLTNSETPPLRRSQKDSPEINFGLKTEVS
jgi:hypothetical protein